MRVSHRNMSAAMRVHSSCPEIEKASARSISFISIDPFDIVRHVVLHPDDMNRLDWIATRATHPTQHRHSSKTKARSPYLLIMRASIPCEKTVCADTACLKRVEDWTFLIE